MEIGSTRGVKRCRMRMTSRLTAAYRRPSTGRKTTAGHRAAAVRNGIAEWIPNRRAS